ncbi:uncharacterized protein LOC129895748 isoform X2 [Solanum dulcamara]|uniref:uncharacterized protein LOC129895748 isoform X2 n=1 Tax=Solanum dulcamara TaxID=45834 RepID=UPI002484EA47|nr:uncharacterized protein LOC129895748 isoform X2 [Solanum dulcamara]
MHGKNNREDDEWIRMPNPRVTLASTESLSIPLEIVFLADYRCTICQQRVAQLMSKMKGETKSILVSVVEKKMTLTCEYSKKEEEEEEAASRFAVLMRSFLSSCTS